jgi:glutamate racemase
VKKDVDGLLNNAHEIDTVLLACTHYPLLMEKIKQNVPGHVQIISQGEIVAASLKDYLERHPEIEEKCSKNSQLRFYTTDSVKDFDRHSATFFGREVNSIHVDLW